MLLEDHWMNSVDDYDVQIRDYCIMRVQLSEKVLNLEIPLKAWNKNAPLVLDPLYNRDKIYERPIINEEIW